MKEIAQGDITSRLVFCCADALTVEKAAREGLRPREHTLPAFERFEEAQAACPDRLIVIDAYASEAAGHDWRVYAPPASICNVAPYRPAVLIVAGGGIVTRRRGAGTEVLLIFRRGMWDLPKGKAKKKESVRRCALREVQEELGIDAVHLGQPLGATVYGYDMYDRRGQLTHAVKTTHWFQMTTSEEEFRPQLEEDITGVAWFAWEEALQRTGFEVFRRHMARIEHLVA